MGEARRTARRAGRMLTVFASVTGTQGPLWFLIDSGNLRGTLLDEQARRDSLLFLQADSTLELRVGTQDPIRVPAHSAKLIVDGVLGTDYLLRGALAIDLRRLP